MGARHESAPTGFFRAWALALVPEPKSPLLGTRVHDLEVVEQPDIEGGEEYAPRTRMDRDICGANEPGDGSSYTHGVQRRMCLPPDIWVGNKWV